MSQTPENIHEYFKYVTDKDQEWTAIGLTEKAGEFQGVVYRYGTIVPPKEPSSKADLYNNKDEVTDKLPFKFEWQILDSNGLEKERFNDKFFTLIGDILVHIIFKEDLYREREHDRKNNT
jgi:hypothetical protein|tara:strand:- start:1057 stop:1416 length:360 start_codon:yes stop_codon:yes gene_type:complete